MSAVVVAAALAFLPARGLLTREWTIQLELDFVRRHLATMEDGCRIIYVADIPGNSGGLWVSPVLSRETGRRHSWVDVAEHLRKPDIEGCTVYYQPALCHSVSVGVRWDPQSTVTVPVCAAIKEKHRLEPVVETSLPALPYVGERYTMDPVVVGFYRLRAR